MGTKIPNLRIRSIDSPIICGKDFVGKWFAASSIDGPDGDPINRYLQLDGSWGKTTRYFNSKEEVESALSKGSIPDFNLSRQELEDRATIRQMSRDSVDIYEERY